jgi:hypothetical protein
MAAKCAALAGLVLIATGCNGHGRESRAVLYQGVALHHPGTTVANHPVSDAAARRRGASMRKQWERDVRGRAIEAPREHFANLSPDTLKNRLAEAAHNHDFQVVAVKPLRPKQLAPEIAVRTMHYRALSRALPGILRSLDPHSGPSDTRGWSYEGFFFEARDERKVPFLVVDNAWRGQHKGGGQWARSERLFPFAHG